MLLQVVLSASHPHQSVRCPDLNTRCICLYLSKITHAHSIESLPPFPLPNPSFCWYHREPRNPLPIANSVHHLHHPSQRLAGPTAASPWTPPAVSGRSVQSSSFFFFFSTPRWQRCAPTWWYQPSQKSSWGFQQWRYSFFGWQASTTTPPIHFKTYITPNTNVAYNSAGGSFLASCRIKCCQPYSSLRAHLSASSTDMSWYELLEWCHATVKVDFYPFFWTGGWGTPDPGQWYIDQKEVHKFHLDIWQEASQGGLNTAKKAKSCQAV